MQIKIDFDTKEFDKLDRRVKKAVPRAIKFVIDQVAKDLRINYQNVTAPKLEIAQKSGKLRPFTKSAVLFKKSRLKDLVSTVYMKDEQYEYLKNVLDVGRVGFKYPKKNPNLAVPDTKYNRRRSYGQPQKRGGIKRAKDFWLPNKKGGYSLYERKGKKINAIWHTAKSLKYDRSTLPYYGDMFKYFKKKKKRYTGKLFRDSMLYNLRRIK